MEESVRNEYFELLRFRSVGADPLHLRDCVQCAIWLKAWLARLGFAHHDHVLFARQERGQSNAHDGVVVGKEYADRLPGVVSCG